MVASTYRDIPRTCKGRPEQRPPSPPAYPAVSGSVASGAGYTRVQGWAAAPRFRGR
jgi:hypothetical protein